MVTSRLPIKGLPIAIGKTESEVLIQRNTELFNIQPTERDYKGRAIYTAEIRSWKMPTERQIEEVERIRNHLEEELYDLTPEELAELEIGSDSD